MKQLISFVFLFLFSCSDSYELIIEPETNEEQAVSSQKYRLDFNGSVSFPNGVTKKEIDPKKDHFEVTKIKFIPIKKWTINNSDDNEWGQAGIRIRIIKKGDLLSNDDVIMENWLYHIYNPGIVNLTTNEENKIRSINEDLDSGLGDGNDDNLPFWEDYRNPIFNKSFLENRPENLYHSLIYKLGPAQALGNYQINNSRIQQITSSNVKDLATLVGSSSSLTVDDLSRCTIIFPYDSLRLVELRNF